MSDKKHIDRLFQERLKDLDITPPPKVWGDLEAKLKKQNKPKRVIPIWWRASGVAALLLLFLALGYFIYNSNSTIPNSPSRIVDTPISKNLDPETHTSVGSNDTDSTSDETEQQKEDRSDSVEEKTNATQIVNQFKKKEGVGNATQNGIQYNSKTSVVTADKSDKPSEVKNASQYTPDAIALQAPNASENSNSKIKDTSNTNSEAVVSREHSTTRPPKSDTGSEIILAESTRVRDHSKTASNDREVTPETVSSSTSTLDTLSIEEAIAATKNAPEVDEKSKKWAIQPNVAPVYYSSTGKGSHLDDQFVNNSKSGEINTSYGVAVGYALNKKLKLRSGVNNLKLSFNTNDVILFETLGYANTGMPSLENMSATNQTENLSFFSSSKVENLQSSSFINSTENSSDINQNISYFEVPLELEYTILNKRIGISLIGGFSTFILEDNRIYSEGDNSRTYIGEATNINDLSFSTNFGIGFDYNFSNRFNFNLEPTLKYQLNAYDNVSGSFNPYIIGVYTGFSYKF